ncbi:MAG: aldo/keto reductase [Gammaproteobacteria bacterium]
MRRRRIGDLEVSVVGIGCNQFGPTCDAAQTARVVGRALDLGINFFDVADEYGPEGLAEEYLGRALGPRRGEAVIATKFGHHMHGDPQRGGASARWIERAVEDSLRRLGTDCIDLYQQHFPDPAVPAQETLAAQDRLVRAGKVRAIGCCNLEAADLRERAAIAGAQGLTRLASAQNRLNLLRQEALEDLVPTIQALDMALLPFFPLASGMLSGRYRAGEPPPADSRFGRHLPPAQARRIIDRDFPRVQALDAWAAARGRTVAELAIAWLAALPAVASVIAGATTLAQVESNARAGAWELTAEEWREAAALGHG